jgi:hypothetical protein
LLEFRRFISGHYQHIGAAEKRYKRTLSRLIARRKIAARKDGVRTLVDVASLKAYYEALPLKTDHAPLVFGHRAHVVPSSRR